MNPDAPDPLDIMLDASAPAGAPPRPEDVNYMIAQAAQRAAPRRRHAPLVVGGVVIALVAGGTGVAAASDGFSWAPWAQDPAVSIEFTMASGLRCEIRHSEYSGGADPSVVRDVNGVLDEWYRSGETLSAVQRLVPSVIDDLGPDFGIAEGEDPTSLTEEQVEHADWVREWTAWNTALSEAEFDELARQGITADDPGMSGSERAGQINCRDTDGTPFVPGAGS